MTFHTTFITGLIQFKNLPRMMFGNLQAKQFPFYFGLQSIFSLVLLLTTCKILNVTSFSRFLAWLTLTNQEQSFDDFQIYNFMLCLGFSVINYSYIGPVSTGVMFQIHKIEKAKPEETPTELKELKKRFGMLHGASSLLNLVVFGCALVNCFWLGHRLDLTMISNSAASTQPTDELDLLQLDPHFNQIFGDPFLPQRNLSYDNIDSFMLDEPIFASPNPNVPSSPESIFNSPPQQQLPNHFDLTAFNPNNASSLTNLMTTFTGNSMLPSLASLATNFSTSNLVSKLSNSNNFNLEINSTNSTDAVNSISSPLLMKFDNSNNINKKVEKKKKSDKRKKLTAEEREAKIQERILRNRQAAQESRDKKKEYVSNLEVTNENLSTQNVQLVELVKQSETQNQNLLSLVQSLSQELDRLKRNQSGLPPSPSPEAENLLGYGDVSSLTLPEPLNSTAHVIRNPAHSHRTAPYTLPSNNNYLSLIGSESSNKAGSCFVAVKKEPGLLTEIKTEPVSPPTSPESWTSLIERSPPPPSPSLINKEIASDAVITTLLTSLSFMALRPNSGLFARNLWSESEYGFKRNNWKKEKESLGISPRFHSILSPLKEERPLLRKRSSIFNFKKNSVLAAAGPSAQLLSLGKVLHKGANKFI
ncbi:hypothetical protein HDU92_005591 [Lobulomyces angularis]|nr:hypothetical protein HDU92_005591 [Lobulomyces angularis]